MVRDYSRQRHSYAGMANASAGIPPQLRSLFDASKALCETIDVTFLAYSGDKTELYVRLGEKWGMRPVSARAWMGEARKNQLFTKLRPDKCGEKRAHLQRVADLCSLLEIPVTNESMVAFKAQVDSRYPGQFVYPSQQNL